MRRSSDFPDELQNFTTGRKKAGKKLGHVGTSLPKAKGRLAKAGKKLDTITEQLNRTGKTEPNRFCQFFMVLDSLQVIYQQTMR